MALIWIQGRTLTRAGSIRFLKGDSPCTVFHHSFTIHHPAPMGKHPCMHACVHPHALNHTLILWLKQLAALTKIEYSIYIRTLRRRNLQFLLYLTFSSLTFPPLFCMYSISWQALFVISSSDSDAVPQFQGTLQAWRVAMAAISGENNCVLKVDVTTSTCEAITARVVSAVEMNQINRLWLINQFS